VALLAFAHPAASASEPTGGLEAGTSVLTATPTLVGETMHFAGTLGPSRYGLVEIQLRGLSGDWKRVATARTDGAGAFAAEWPASQTGAFTARAVSTTGAQAAQAAAPPTTSATVYRRATATWYDLAGRVGACGIRLRKGTVGLAHRTLPCGTRVDITYAGRTLTVPVIDRGPFVRGVSYDFTAAAADRLGFVRAGRVRLGVLPQAERAPKNPLTAVPTLGASGGLTPAL